MMLTMALFILTVVLMTSIISSVIIMAGLTFALALSVSALLGLWYSSSMGLMLFTIYIGGLLVVFGYFLMAGPNEHFSSKSWEKKVVVAFTFFVGLLTTTLIEHFFEIEFFSCSESTISFLSLSDYWLVMPVLSLVLFFSMVVVVKGVNLKAGPMRPFSLSSARGTGRLLTNPGGGLTPPTLLV